MKLSQKLLLSFSSLVVLMLVIAGLSWNSMQYMARQNSMIISAEDSLSAIYLAEIAVLNGIAEMDEKKFDIALNNADESLKDLQDVKKIAKSSVIIEHTDAAINDIMGFAPMLHGIKKNVKDLKELDESLKIDGDINGPLLAKFKARLAEDYIATGDSYYANMNFKVGLTLDYVDTIRQNRRNYQITPTPELRKSIEEGMQNINASLAECFAYARNIDDIGAYIAPNNTEESTDGTSIDNLTDFEIMEKVAVHVKGYLETLPKFIGTMDALNTMQVKVVDLAYKLSEDGIVVSSDARAEFITATNSAIMMLIISAIIATVIGFALAVLVNRNVLAQLGTDPGHLAMLTKRVSDGDYDIDDGLPHRGVHNGLIGMVNEMKKALFFSDGILKSLPVPCAVFGTDNVLQFANASMLDLLGHNDDPKEYYGMNSGEFMYRDENYETATKKVITDRERQVRKAAYTTARNNNIHVNITAEPLFDAQSNMTNVISIWLDTTEETTQNQLVAVANENMQSVARELQQVAAITSETSLALSAELEKSGEGAHEQADRVASAATALEEMNATVLEVARSASTTSEAAANVRIEAISGSESMQICVGAMHNVREESLRLKEEMNTLSGHANAINEIMNVISDIADQTNLLALNAAIEAARAGDAGRGFAVVADEVRKLAEKTMTSTTDVGNAIAAIQQSTADNTRLVEGAVEKIESVTEMVSSAGNALLGIVTLADSTADQVRAIATASEEQSATSEEITRSVDEVSNIAKNNEIAMTEAASAVGELVSQTHILTELVHKLQNEKD